MPRNILKSSLAAVPDPMLFIDEDGNISLSNGAADTLFGDWIQRRSYVTALRQPALLQMVEDVFGGGPGGETRFVRTDQAGETLFQVRVTPLKREEAEVDGVLLHFSDITHLREAEEMRSNFVANVSHELRTPLTALSGFIETLRGPAKDDAEARDRFLGIMDVEASRMNRLVQDLLSLSRVESEERVRPSEDVNLMHVLQSVKATLRPQSEDRTCDVVIETDAAHEDLTIRGDKDQLTQVFMNLTENAIKYGKEGKPVTLRMSLGMGKGSMRGPLVQVDVQDRGDGIDPIHLPRLTERFYRIDSHRSRAMGGTGLGLAIVKHIINRHRGRMRIHSEIGKGSIFSVILPRG